jgi:hypothetical protein
MVPLAIVEDYRHVPFGGNGTVTVEQAMIAFKKRSDDSGSIGSNKMKNLSLLLAHIFSLSFGGSWGFVAEQLSGEYQNLITEYLEDLMSP